MSDSNKLLHVFCSLQRALLGKVTPNLRSVYIEIPEANSYNLIFYCHEELSEEEEELCSLVDTEFMADFPSPNYKTSYQIEVIPYPRQIPKKGFCVFQRFED